MQLIGLKKPQKSLKRSKKKPFFLSVMLFGVIFPLRHFPYSAVCALSLNTTVLSGVNAPPALSLPQMFSLLNRFIPLTLKGLHHISICVYIWCRVNFSSEQICSLPAKESGSAQTQTGRQSKTFPKQSSPGSCATCPQEDRDLCQTPCIVRLCKKEVDLAQSHCSCVCSQGWRPSSPSTTSQLSRTLKPNQNKQSRTGKPHVPPKGLTHSQPGL